MKFQLTMMMLLSALLSCIHAAERVLSAQNKDDFESQNEFDRGMEFENEEELGRDKELFDEEDGDGEESDDDWEDGSWDDDSNDSSALSTTLKIVGFTAVGCVLLIGLMMLINKRENNARNKWEKNRISLASSPRESVLTL